MEEKKLYPFRFIPIEDVEGQKVHIADLGYQDSLVRNGWLAGNSISEIMDMYMDRVVGENVFDYYGRQFPLLVKWYSVKGRSNLTVHPDDELAEQRFDFLGKSKIIYITKASADSRLYLGFAKDTNAGEFFSACSDNSTEGLLNIVKPSAGEFFYIYPGLVHAFENVDYLEISESSPLDFQLYAWGGKMEGDEIDEGLTLEEALDFIDYKKFQRRGLEECREFSVSPVEVVDPVHVRNDRNEEFVIYICAGGEVSVQVPFEDETGAGKMDSTSLKCGESILIPAEVEEYFLVAKERGTMLIEAASRKKVEENSYLNTNNGLS